MTLGYGKANNAKGFAMKHVFCDVCGHTGGALSRPPVSPGARCERIKRGWRCRGEYVMRPITEGPPKPLNAGRDSEP